MHIVIYGVGAVGGFYGSLLARAARNPNQKHKTKISFLARGKTLDVLKQEGLTLTIDHGPNAPEGFKEGVTKTEGMEITKKISDGSHLEIIKQKVDVYEHYKDIKNPEAVLLCTKSKDTKESSEDIETNLPSQTFVVSIQNGVENEEVIADVIGRPRVVGCLTNLWAQATEPGDILNRASNYNITFGELDGEKSDRVKALKEIFLDAGVPTKTTKYIKLRQWTKLVWNAGFNPISALHELEVGQLLENKKYRAIVQGIMEETIEVAHAQGIMVPSDTADKWIASTDTPAWYHFKTSTLQDILRGRPIELEELLGIIVRRGKEYGVETPNSNLVYKALKEKIEKMSLKA